MSTERIHIEPEILKEAIVRSGEKEENFLLRHPVVKEWSEGKKSPTFKQLERFAKEVHLPIGYLFLDKLPAEETSIPFFRKGKNPSDFNLNVYDTVLLIQKRQDWLSEYLENNEYDPLSFTGAFQNKGEKEIVPALRELLGLKEDWARDCRDGASAVNLLTERIENKGIAVSFNSIVGNNTRRKIEVEECRGFSLVNPYAPFIFVNSADSKSAQLFTLVHETAHVLIGYSAGYGGEDVRETPAGEKERLCDSIAAEFLVPYHVFEGQWKKTPQNYDSLAKYFKVSPVVIARRALDCRWITKDNFFSFYNRYKMDFLPKGKRKGGGDFYVTEIKRIGKAFATHIRSAVSSDQLLYRDAYMLTGLKGTTLNHLFQTQLP